jgi:UDP-N-acetylglucosamine diphosphorylase/glucosamine-1-phosphate N-acetyltransferase
MTDNKDIVVVIMAGGLGKRMNSNIPKVLHKIKGVSMISRILHNVTMLSCINREIQIKSIMVVVGKYKNEIKQSIENETDIYIDTSIIEYVDQPEALGTGNAIQCCNSNLLKNPNTNVLILSGDVPLLSSHTMEKMVIDSTICKIAVTRLENPYGYGRIVTQNNCFDKIIEEKDCTEEEKQIQLVNGGVYCIQSSILCKYMFDLTNANANSEYYLTDIVEIIKRNEAIDIELYEVSSEKQIEIMGVNTVEQLHQLESLVL